MRKVNVFDDETNVIARVNFNNKLDFWDGHNWSSGSVGRHLGITRLKDGRIVFIHGSDWQGSRDVGRIVSKSEALNAILSSHNEEILDDPKFRDLYGMYKRIQTAEMDDFVYDEKDIIEAICCWWSEVNCEGESKESLASKRIELEKAIGYNLPQSSSDLQGLIDFIISSSSKLPLAKLKPNVEEV
jgi:hypothetical protein